MTYREALFALTALSALWKVSSPNCSMYAWPTESVIVSSSACSLLVYYLSVEEIHGSAVHYLLKFLYQSHGISHTFGIGMMEAL